MLTFSHPDPGSKVLMYSQCCGYVLDPDMNSDSNLDSKLLFRIRFLVCCHFQLFGVVDVLNRKQGQKADPKLRILSTVQGTGIFNLESVLNSSVADPECLSRIQLFSIPDPGKKLCNFRIRMHAAFKNLKSVF